MDFSLPTYYPIFIYLAVVVAFSVRRPDRAAADRAETQDAGQADAL